MLEFARIVSRIGRENVGMCKFGFSASFFKHQGYGRGKQNEDDFEEKISKKALLNLTVYFNQDDGPAKMTCSKPLYATSFRFEIE